MLTKSFLIPLAFAALFSSTATGSLFTGDDHQEDLQGDYYEEGEDRFLQRGSGGRGSGGGMRGSGGGGRGNRPNFMNITCTGDIDFSCDLPRDEEPGVFVCRERRNNRGPVPRCIPTDRAIEGDECGCCGGECPVPCDACLCDLPDSDKEGVEVLVPDSEEPICVPKFASARMVYRSEGMVTCNEECP